MFLAMIDIIEQEWIPEVNEQMKRADSSMPGTEKGVLALDPTVSHKMLNLTTGFL
jgi:hypothetical protein